MRLPGWFAVVPVLLLVAACYMRTGGCARCTAHARELAERARGLRYLLRPPHLRAPERDPG